MKRFLRSITATVLLGLLILTACGGRDDPPDDGTPGPPALDGLFVSGGACLSFNGDGKSVTLDVSPALAETSGLPQGVTKGTYVFLFRNEAWRYDKAETVRFLLDGETYAFKNAVGVTGENVIAVYLIDGEDAVIFKREG